MGQLLSMAHVKAYTAYRSSEFSYKGWVINLHHYHMKLTDKIITI
jgi:hypothetical protein